MNNYLFRLLAFGLYVLFGLFFWFNPFEALSTYMSYLGLSYLFLTFFTYYLAKKAALSPMPYQSFLSALILALICLLFPNLSLSVVVWLFIGLFLLAALFYLFSVWQNKENKHLISLIFSLILLAFGIYMLFVPEFAYLLLGKLFALAIFLNGLSFLLTTKKRKKD